MSDLVISARGLRKAFRDARFDLEILRGVDLDLRRSERLAIVGASGTGKSTLLHLLGGLDSATAGEVRVLGELHHQEGIAAGLAGHALGALVPADGHLCG